MILLLLLLFDHLCGLMVKVWATDTEVLGSIPGDTIFSEE
jgi:hypothetical protein